MQTLNVNYSWQARIIRTTFALLKHKDIILSSMTQTTEKWDSLLLSRADFWMVWRCHGISWFNFYFFWFRTNSKKNTWMRKIFVTIMVIMSKIPFRKLLDISCFQGSQQLQVTLKTLFGRHKISRTSINKRNNSFLDKYI